MTVDLSSLYEECCRNFEGGESSAKAFIEWVKSRPEDVQRLCVEFPIGTQVEIDDNGTIAYLLGYTEDDTLILSTINPKYDYDGASGNKLYICAAHLRKEVP